jgi:hypothetical protein
VAALGTPGERTYLTSQKLENDLDGRVLDGRQFEEKVISPVNTLALVISAYVLGGLSVFVATNSGARQLDDLRWASATKDGDWRCSLRMVRLPHCASQHSHQLQPKFLFTEAITPCGFIDNALAAVSNWRIM